MTHGGLNPSIVMLTTGGPKLLDFGVAKLQGETVPARRRDDGDDAYVISSLSSVPAFAAAVHGPRAVRGERG